MGCLPRLFTLLYVCFVVHWTLFLLLLLRTHAAFPPCCTPFLAALFFCLCTLLRTHFTVEHLCGCRCGLVASFLYVGLFVTIAPQFLVAILRCPLRARVVVIYTPHAFALPARTPAYRSCCWLSFYVDCLPVLPAAVPCRTFCF